jgi:hypothetical protein
MTPVSVPVARCQNDACPRPVEPDERYCAACGLERALFRPEARRKSEENRSARAGETAGR